MELYVYYRVPAARLSDWDRAVHAHLQAAMHDEPGLAARALCRVPDAARPSSADSPPDTVTVMEIYTRSPEPLDRAAIDRLDAAARAAVASCSVSERHRELFAATASLHSIP
jgi:hypothetical protein